MINCLMEIIRGKKILSSHTKQQKTHIELFHCIDTISKNREESRVKSVCIDSLSISEMPVFGIRPLSIRLLRP